jgi:hypothetical protein
MHSNLMDLSEKKQKLSVLLQATQVLGFVGFEAVDEQEALKRGVPKSQLERDAPAFYLPEFEIAIFRLEQIIEHRKYTNYIDFLFAHEFAHYLTDRFIKDNAELINKILANYSNSVFIRAIKENSTALTLNMIHDYYPGLVECFTNEIAYHFLAHFETLKYDYIIYSSGVEQDDNIHRTITEVFKNIDQQDVSTVEDREFGFIGELFLKIVSSIKSIIS